MKKRFIIFECVFSVLIFIILSVTSFLYNLEFVVLFSLSILIGILTTNQVEKEDEKKNKINGGVNYNE